MVLQAGLVHQLGAFSVQGDSFVCLSRLSFCITDLFMYFRFFDTRFPAEFLEALYLIQACVG